MTKTFITDNLEDSRILGKLRGRKAVKRSSCTFV